MVTRDYTINLHKRLHLAETDAKDHAARVDDITASGRATARSAALLCGATDSPREAAVRSQRPSKSPAALGASARAKTRSKRPFTPFEN